MNEHDSNNRPSLEDASAALRIMEMLDVARTSHLIAKSLMRAPDEDRPAVARYLLAGPQRNGGLKGVTWQQFLERAPVIARASAPAFVRNGRVLVLSFDAEDGTYKDAQATPRVARMVAEALASRDA